MQSPSVTETLADTKALAHALKVRGVPFYLVGDRVMTPDPARFPQHRPLQTHRREWAAKNFKLIA